MSDRNPVTPLIHGGGGNMQLDFSSMASSEPNVLALRERKVCEGYCGGSFWRLPAPARQGEKLCARCKARFAKAALTADMRRGELIGTRRKFSSVN